eukprot:Nitzschia sp. Nitz4//scaffold83_size84149//15906//16150//NITZ4_005166-RA/size84149-processed-gene-0.19-mRNA-1//1//CDS//3329558923//8910//frame0
MTHLRSPKLIRRNRRDSAGGSRVSSRKRSIIQKHVVTSNPITFEMWCSQVRLEVTQLVAILSRSSEKLRLCTH